MKVHTSYEVSKRLKEFMGESAPEPIIPLTYTGDGDGPYPQVIGGIFPSPCYQIHDLISKPFCEAMEKASAQSKGCLVWKYILCEKLASAYFNDGLPAVEAALMKMMDKEK